MHSGSELVEKAAETWRVLNMGISKRSKGIRGLDEVVKASRYLLNK